MQTTFLLLVLINLVYLGLSVFICMVTFSELRACKRCGNVFSIQIGSTKFSDCPQCKNTELEIIEEDKELVQE